MTEPDITIRQVISGPGRSQWLTACQAPECNGWTSADLFQWMAIEVRVQHLTWHAQQTMPAGVNVTGADPVTRKTRTMAASGNSAAKTGQRPPATSRRKKT